MKPEDRTLLLGQLDQHSSYLLEAAKLRVKIKRARRIMHPLSMACTAALPLLVITLSLLPFFPMAAAITGVVALLLLWIALMAMKALSKPEQDLEHLEKAHETYMESVVGKGNYLYLQRHGGSTIFSAQVREKETGELILDLGTTEYLPLGDYIRG